MIICYFLSLLLQPVQAADIPGPFEEVHAYMKKNCIECHGAYQAPMFAVSDIDAAYAAAKSVRDFDITIVNQSKNGHCGKEVCSAENADFVSAVQRWKALEGFLEEKHFTWQSTPRSPHFKKGQRSTQLHWKIQDLGYASVPAHVKASVSLTVTRQDGYFLVRDLRVHLSHGTLLLEGIHLLQSDRILTVPELESGSFSLMASKQSIGFEMRPWHAGDDVVEKGISIALDRIEWKPELSWCQSIGTFKKTVYASLKRRACIQCHTQEAPALQAWTMHPDLKILCAQAKSRIDRNDFMNSPLVRAALGKDSEHGALVPTTSEVDPDWIRWMEEEQ